MECNKEEAFRAKIIAEKKMQDNDFLAARKFSLKAQELYPETENITQMVCICDVHFSAQNKMFGNDMDWYGILQVEHTADDALIKKQYRKLAFLLHPDKNKFSGAESAFKLLGEAQRVLLDREKRSLYDMKRRTTYKPVVANHASKQKSKVQRNSVDNVYQDPKQQPQSGDSNEGNTFWTQCPYCGVRYQFFKEVQDRALRCQACNKPFVAYHQATQPIPKTTQPVFPQKDSSNDDAVNQKPILDPVSQEELSTSGKTRKSQKGSQSSKRANNFPQKDSSNDDAVNQKPILDPVSQEELSTSQKARKSQKGSQSSKRANNFPQKDSSNDDAVNQKPILDPVSQEELCTLQKARKSQKGSQSFKRANTFPQKNSSNDDAVNQKPILDPVSQEELSTSQKARKSQKGAQSSKRANNVPQRDSSNDDAVNQKPILDPASQEELSTPRKARKLKKGSQSSNRANNLPQKDSSNDDAVNQKPILNPVSQEELSTSRIARDSQKGSQSSKGANNKRGRKFMVESSESLKSDTSIDLEGLEMQIDDVGDSHSRRSSRNKRNVSYNEKNASVDDDETMCIPKRTKGSGSGEQKPSTVFNNSNGEETVVEPMKKSFEPENDSVKDSNPEETPDPTLHEYPDPEFCDFDKDREKHCFKVGQVWAAYDTVDVMPRFYARIKRVYSRGFKLQITWLEPAPDDEDEHGLKWVESQLPFPCGKFVLGDSEYTEDRLMFSHEVCLDKSTSGRDSIKIYPRKGETWALFKNWDAKWYETMENERKFEYEFVEVISEYDETVGIRVARLDKQKGYASLYFPAGGNEVIPSTEILRFAHRVLSYRMTGNERHDIPKGSFELDLASVITNP